MTTLKAADTADLRHLSASTLNDLLVCERRWAYGHGVDPEVEPAPSNASMVLGTVVHVAIRRHHDGENGEVALLKAIAEEAAEGGDVSLAQEHALRLFRLWRQHPVSQWKPKVQEEKFELDVGGFQIIGFLDARDDEKIVDWKTASRVWDAKKERDGWLQATAYSMATGIPEVRFVVMSYGDPPQVNTYKRTVTAADHHRLRALVRVYGPRVQSSSIEDYAISGATANNWLCSEKWCAYWTVCPGGGR